MPRTVVGSRISYEPALNFVGAFAHKVWHVDDPSFELGATDSLVLVAGVRPGAVTGVAQTVVGKAAATAASIEYRIQVAATARFAAALRLGSTTYTANNPVSSLIIGRKYIVALAYSFGLGTLTLYQIDLLTGAVVSTETTGLTGVPNTTTSLFTVGAQSDAANPFTGDIGPIYFYRGAAAAVSISGLRSGARMLQYSELSPAQKIDLIHAYMLNAGGSLVVDLVSDPKNLTPSSAATTPGVTESGFIGGPAPGRTVRTIYRPAAGRTMLSDALPPTPIHITSPSDWQVFQREDISTDIEITGTIDTTDTIEARIGSDSWQEISAAITGSFTGMLNVSQTQGRLQVRPGSQPLLFAVRENVGVGHLFAIWGQSNSAGWSANRYGYSHATRKAGLFGNDYLWHELTDPSDSKINQVDMISSETPTGPGGSVWPLITTHFLVNNQEGIAWIPCAKGGTSARKWLPGGEQENLSHTDRTTLYGSAVYRCQLVGSQNPGALHGKIECAMWWQGESDANDAAVTEELYIERVGKIADGVMADLGCKLMVAKLQTITAPGYAGQSMIRSAHDWLWNNHPNVLPGPDLQPISVGLHLDSNVHMNQAADLWWAAMQDAFSYT